MKFFRKPINHPYIQNLTDFDLAFLEVSEILDDPKARDKLMHTFYDDEFDDYFNGGYQQNNAYEPTEEELLKMEEALLDDLPEDDWEEV